MFHAFFRNPHSLYQRPGGLNNHSPAFYEHININTKTVACINTALMLADTSEILWCSITNGKDCSSYYMLTLPLGV